MVNGRSEFHSGSRNRKSDLEAFRERVTEPIGDELDEDGSCNYNESHASNSNSNHFHGVGRTGAIVLGIISGLALGCGIYAEIEASKAEREARMLQYYLLELDAKFIAAGLKKPDDAISKKLEEEK